MERREFEDRYREQVRVILNQLQSAMMVSSRLEVSLADIGHSVQALTRDVEKFLSEEEPGDPPGSTL
ncbi:hypothetical protein [Pseudanabaena sp. FACHB-2040]|uniref:hypothetical protein n=1 Tax=Pseudanabaena sp. FACHB-2040 TaxID=2692859 RepID=UPI0016842824|nr:hypothetical protein [Pseudanabaena sp. FACHB-2040]MBD0268424.1 hypothetical protein [Cyanobacteria bacterium Co-bin8]MBD2258579.1 hypothetical protein [Pseudanabaena sp. FACHB-2040]